MNHTNLKSSVGWLWTDVSLNACETTPEIQTQSISITPGVCPAPLHPVSPSTPGCTGLVMYFLSLQASCVLRGEFLHFFSLSSFSEAYIDKNCIYLRSAT